MTKDRLLRIGRRMAREIGLINLSLAGVCKEAGIPEGSFRNCAGVTFGEYLTELRSMVNPKKVFPVVKKRVQKDLRIDHILRIAVMLAEKKGYRNISREEIAITAEVTPSIVSFHFHSMDKLRMAVMRHALENENLKIIAQGLALQDPWALKAPIRLKKAAAKQMIFG